MPPSIRLKAFRSMPDVARFAGSTTITPGGGGGYQLALTCGHKDCRDYYRLQALRSDLQVGRKRPDKPSLEKPGLFREREIELTSSSEEEEDDEGQNARTSGLGGNTTSEAQLSPMPNPLASDAYSVHGLSDAISVDSSKEGSEATSLTAEESDGSGNPSSHTSTNSPVSLRPPSRVSSANRSLPRIASLTKRLDSPASSRSRVRVHPTAPNLMVYEYEA